MAAPEEQRSISRTEKVQQASATVKESGEIALLSAFSKVRWFEFMMNSLAHFILMPLIGVTFLVNTVIDGIKFSRADNKNFDKTFALAASLLSGITAVASITGTLVGEWLNFPFAAGPWLFVASLGVGLAHRYSKLGLDLFRAYQAPAGSIERKSYLKASFNHGFSLVLLSAITASVFFVMIAPITPAITPVIAVTAAALTGVSLGWRALKTFAPRCVSMIKEIFGLARFQAESLVIKESARASESNQVSDAAAQGQHGDDQALLEQEAEGPKFERVSPSFFKPAYHRHKVKQLLREHGKESARAYLEAQINGKKREYDEDSEDVKASDKLNALVVLGNVLNQEFVTMDNVSLGAKAFQSFFAYRSETEELFDAVKELEKPTVADASLS